jgi:hypothetical protein
MGKNVWIGRRRAPIGTARAAPFAQAKRGRVAGNDL